MATRPAFRKEITPQWRKKLHEGQATVIVEGQTLNEGETKQQFSIEFCEKQNPAEAQICPLIFTASFLDGSLEANYIDLQYKNGNESHSLLDEKADTGIMKGSTFRIVFHVKVNTVEVHIGDSCKQTVDRAVAFENSHYIVVQGKGVQNVTASFEDGCPPC